MRVKFPVRVNSCLDYPSPRFAYRASLNLLLSLLSFFISTTDTTPLLNPLPQGERGGRRARGVGEKGKQGERGEILGEG
jgi:hypothetical protein